MNISPLIVSALVLLFASCKDYETNDEQTNDNILHQVDIENEQPKSINIYAKFIEIDNENTDQLGFDWILPMSEDTLEHLDKINQQELLDNYLKKLNSK